MTKICSVSRVPVSLLLCLLFSHASARADDCVVPAGAESPCTGKPLSAPHFLLPREWIDKVNAELTVSEALERELTVCNAELAEAEKEAEDGHSWATTFAISAAAFAFGMTAGVLIVVAR
jgi:hypothetical protein